MREAWVRVKVDRVPEGDGPEFDEWCEKYDCYPLNGGRRAWCIQFATYLRGAFGVAHTEGGETFLVDEAELHEVPA